MKRYFAIALLMWLICGLVGAWSLEGSNFHLKTLAYGPIALLAAFNQQPSTDMWPY